MSLFGVTHRVPDDESGGDPPYTFVTNGIEFAVEQARKQERFDRVRRQRGAKIGVSTITLPSSSTVAVMPSVDRGLVPDLPDRIIASIARPYEVRVRSRDCQIILSTVETVW